MSSSVLPLALAQALGPVESARPVNGASRYWITDHGRVLSVINGVRALRPSPNAKGYLCVDLQRDPDRDPALPRRWGRYVHELVMLAFTGPRPVAPGVAYEIDHVDGDKTNNSLTNLQYVTRSLNLQRALAAGRNPTVKLSPVAVWTFLCRAYAEGDSVVDQMAQEYEMTVQAVRSALAGRSWRYVPDPASRPSAGKLAAALFLDSEADAQSLLRLSPFSPDFVGAVEPTTARVLPFRMSAGTRAA